MVAIGLAINKIVSLHRCNCGRHYEQWNDQPTPPCPDGEKTRPSKTSLRKRVREGVETSGKRAKLEERTEERQIAPMQDPSSHTLLEPTPDLKHHTPGAVPITPPPVLTSSLEIKTRRDPAFKETAEPQPSRETEKKVVTNSPLQPSQGHNCLKRSPPHPDPPKKPYMEQQPHQERGVTGPHLTPTSTEGSTSENPTTTKILQANYDPQVSENRGKAVIGGAIEPEETDTPPCIRTYTHTNYLGT